MDADRLPLPKERPTPIITTNSVARYLMVHLFIVGRKDSPMSLVYAE